MSDGLWSGPGLVSEKSPPALTGPQQHPSGTALSGVESGPPVKSLQDTRLRGRRRWEVLALSLALSVPVTYMAHQTSDLK